MTIPKGPEKAGFIQGRKAARDGKLKSDNPYRHWLTDKAIAYADAWDDGFDAATNEPPTAA